MKKASIFILSIAIMSSMPGLAGQYAAESSKMAVACKRYGGLAAHHLFSKDGIKDVGTAYGLIMAMTLIHELGHAVAAKAFCGVPIDVVIGGSREKAPLLEVGGVKLAGFNPLQSDARWEERHQEDGAHYKPTLAQDTAMLVAGPLAQAATCYCAYKLLKKSDKFYVTKATALGGIIDTIFGINGIYGALRVPWSDASKIFGNIKKFCSPH